VPPGSSCGVQVSFRPAALGARNAFLAITGAATNSPKLVALSGTGTNTAPAIVFDPGALVFADQVLRTTSTVQQITITNAGTAALVINSIAVNGGNAGDFLRQTTTCLTTPLAPGRSAPWTWHLRQPFPVRGPPTCGCSATPAPASTTCRSAARASRRSSACCRTRSTSACSRSGIASAPQTIIVQNTGDAELLISAVTVVAPTRPTTLSASNTCQSGALAPGTSCGIGVVFQPSALGPRTASVQITGNATNSPRLVF